MSLRNKYNNDMDKKIKICGLFDATNILAIAKEDINLIGLIFYPKSIRFVREDINNAVDNLPPHIKKVGVFVNATKEEVTQRIAQYHLDYIQLHGDESPEYCASFRERKVKVIKAFSIGNAEDLEKVAPYCACCDLFIFDTPTPEYGGSGRTFDWCVLQHYLQDTPYLLSGGLGLHNIQAALMLHDTRLVGFDLNSKLENQQHIKDITLVKELVKKIREYERI